MQNKIWCRDLVGWVGGAAEMIKYWFFLLYFWISCMSALYKLTENTQNNHDHRIVFINGLNYE